MDDDFQSLSRGVFVVPFSPANNEAGPSRPKRPLSKVYEETYRHFEEAYEAYEADRSEFQLEEITHWLDSLSQTSLLKPVSGTHRLPIAVIQNIAGDVSSNLYQCTEKAFTLETRDAADLSSALRHVAIGITGEQSGTGKKSGKSPMDELEEWYALQKKKPELLLHIQQAQSISPPILAELLYIIAIHPQLRFRVLLSVSSSSLFLSSWTHVEPSLMDLTVIPSGKGSKRGGAVNAILQSSKGKDSPVISIGEDLAEELKRMESMTGAGPAAALKALKWSLLHHNFNSPLSRMAEEHPEHVQAIVQAKSHGRDDIPGGELLQLQLHPDLVSTMDPAPRLSILHALGQLHSLAHAPIRDRDTTPIPTVHGNSSSAARPRKRRRKDTTIDHEDDAKAQAGDSVPTGGELKELETLFSLWRSAGRNINLWDWLEGFREAATHTEEEERQGEDREEVDPAMAGAITRSLRTHKPASAVEDGHANESHSEEAKMEEQDADAQDRLHATFIRFCEEARMMGLVRARGGRTAKRADEVMKSINFI